MKTPSPRTERPPIETERLVLRLPVLDDAPAIAAYYRENGAHLQPWSPAWPDDVHREVFWREQAVQRRSEFTDGRSCAMFMFERLGGALVGNLSLSQIVGGAAQRCVLGYGLAEGAQGRGYMVEAVRAAVDFAFRDLHLHRVTASYMPHNRRSAHVLRRAGFVVEGYARDYLLIDGRWEDHILAGIVCEGFPPGEWKGGGAA